MRAIDRWRRLTRDEKMLAARAAAAVVAMSVGVRVFGIKRMIRDAENQGKSSSGAGCADIVTAVERAGRYVPGGTCLSRSLALTRMLRTRGVGARTKIGVKTGTGFHAHAGVEIDNVPITSASGYTALEPRT